MESTMLTVKFVLFLAMELFVIGALGAVLIAGLYQIVRDKVRESRRLDGVVPDSASDPAGALLSGRKG
ncbi:MAG TPA: hypothetical protein EYP49_20500 [Anaerolineae bacterium]|nr:hypothetical protein [Anaerolineae bacterium]